MVKPTSFSEKLFVIKIEGISFGNNKIFDDLLSAFCGYNFFWGWSYLEVVYSLCKTLIKG